MSDDGIYLYENCRASCRRSFVRSSEVLFNGNTWQQPVTSYDVKNKSIELHLAAFLSPLSSTRAYTASRSFSLSPSCCILRGLRTEYKPAANTPARIYTYTLTLRELIEMKL